MTIFTSLEDSKKLAKYIEPKEGHRFFWEREYMSNKWLFVIYGKKSLFYLDRKEHYSEIHTDAALPAYTLEQLLEEIGEKVYSVGFVMTKEHILYIHFSAKLQDCKEFKSDSILQSAVDALIWVYEQKENKQ